MRRRDIAARRRSMLEPFKVRVLRALLEGSLGSIVLAGLGVPFAHVVHMSAPGFSPGFLAWLWLVPWPAWRLRLTRGRHWPARLLKGLVRLVIVGILLGLVWIVLGQLVWPLLVGAGYRGFASAWGAIPLAFMFVVTRLGFVFAAGLSHRVRGRLRWQLTVSHLAVIILTFISLAGVGSVIVANLLLLSLRPGAPDVARSIAQALSALPGVRQGSTLDRARVQATLDLIESGNAVLPSQPLLTALAPIRLVTMPARVVVTDIGGKVLAQAGQVLCVVDNQRRLLPSPPLSLSVVRRLSGAALAGETISLPLSSTACPGKGGDVQTLSAAAVTSERAARPLGVVVVAMSSSAIPAPAQIVAATIAVFGVATIILSAVWLTPSLVISGSVGYLLARGLTRRLESLSRVTTAIAAGDLTQRAPVNARNEIGRLADDVNRMAAHLEAAIGEMRQARAQAEETLRARQELVASISHELRTPLAIIQAHLDTLAMRQAGPMGTVGAGVSVPEETLQALQNEIERLAALIDDLFSLSRARAGALHVRRDTVDVAALVDDVAGLMRPLAQREGMIALAVEAAPGLPPALADGDRLRQILENLVRNGVRHTPDGGIIVLRVYGEGPWIVVAVADTGEGIPPEHLPHIFERFYRVDRARGRDTGGLGLGLAIVREFVELMGGRVTVESTLGEGSCFRVFLPRAVPAMPSAGPDRVTTPVEKVYR